MVLGSACGTYRLGLPTVTVNGCLRMVRWSHGRCSHGRCDRGLVDARMDCDGLNRVAAQCGIVQPVNARSADLGINHSRARFRPLASDHLTYP
jgi:hypothetical protein